MVGFRIGQLLDISGPSHELHDEEEAPYVTPLLATLNQDFARNIELQELQRDVGRMIDELSAAWEARAETDEAGGFGRPFELLRAGTLRRSEFLHHLDVASFDRDWLRAGELLGQSFGDFGRFHKATLSAYPDSGFWNHREPAELTKTLVILGTTFEDLTGLPEECISIEDSDSTKAAVPTLFGTLFAQGRRSIIRGAWTPYQKLRRRPLRPS